MDQEALDLLAQCKSYIVGCVEQHEGTATREELILIARQYGLIKHAEDPRDRAAGELVNSLVSEGVIIFQKNPDDAVRDAFFTYSTKPKAYVRR